MKPRNPLCVKLSYDSKRHDTGVTCQAPTLVHLLIRRRNLNSITCSPKTSELLSRPYLKKRELLESYMRKLNEEVRMVADPTPSVVINGYLNGLQPPRFFYKVITQTSATFLKPL